MSYRYHNPVAVRFGAGAMQDLVAVLAGRTTVLVTFPEARGIGLVDRVRSLIGGSLAGVVEDVAPNPDVGVLAPMYERFWREHARCETVLAVGGGSVIDTAKVLMVGTPSGRFDELLAAVAAGSPFEPRSVKALIAIPTTAGTGSEVTPWATIWDRAAGVKHSLHLPQTWPEAAIVDPQPMLTLPRAVTVQSALDALSHALEAVWNVNANPVSDTLAVAAARDILAALPSLLHALGDAALRERIALAALMAGMAFSNTKTALAHSISYEMTLRYGVPHGIACSFTLPLVLGRALHVDAQRDAVLARIFDDDLDAAPAQLAAFLRQVGVEPDFAAYGIGADESRRMVDDALGGVRGRNFIGQERQQGPGAEPATRHPRTRP